MLHLSDYIEKYGLRPCYSNKELINEKKETEEEKKRIKSIRANLKLLADKKIEEMVKSSKEIKEKKNNKNAIKDDISELIFINDFVDSYFNMVNYRIIIKDLDTDYSSDENDCIYD